MLFNMHSKFIGTHAFLSASNYHWIKYDEDKLQRTYLASLAAKRGIELHALAHHLIRLGVKLPDTQQTLNLYVNDAIGFKMTPEQMLFVSENCYGTADVIGFNRNFLRIHDLKTGLSEASPHQLEVYAAFFFLEYIKLGISPLTTEVELRIYQNDEVRVYVPDPDDIMHIMDKITTFDRYISTLRREALS